MRLHSVYSRFYRSLNYDFIRASGEKYEPDPWDATSEGNYPFVRVKLRPGITTVVGANESGKSQVLSAIEAALTGDGFERSDFCRYSRFFGVQNDIVLPEFGAVFADVSVEEVKLIESLSGHSDLHDVERVAFFRMNQTPKFRVYVRQKENWTGPEHVKKPSALVDLGVPAPFRIDADVPLPDSVPLEYLVSGKEAAPIGRDLLRELWEGFQKNDAWFESDQTITTNASAISKLFRPVRQATEAEVEMYKLAADLIFKVAGINKGLVQELQEHVKKKNGYANSIVDTINSELAKALDFPHWWSQDSQFELFVSLYEFDLVFMIRDRTGRTYGFDERSAGLKYFLSYFVQYLAHEVRSDGRPEILLMDEPDQFLSASGQQDLLRVFEDFADPKDAGRDAVQVVYVTHSPFLIDKNEADRIRVLEKGEHDEGTRVVTSAAANHYEPLRSAFGSFVAETTFIGNCNLMVEGPSDQVLIAGASRWLRTLGVAARDRLDLNYITIVPAGGTRHIPYLVYLARGRDVDKPPVVVLLDNDKAGNDARDDLAAGGAYGDKLIDADLILQLAQGDLAGLATENPLGVAGIEDMVPFNVAVLAATIYCREFVPTVNPLDLDLTVASVYTSPVSPDGESSKNCGTLKFLERAIAAQTGIQTFHLDKIAFARATLDALTNSSGDLRATEDDRQTAAHNFKLLLKHIALCQRKAERAESVQKISSRINRAKKDFTRTHEGQARREDVVALIEEISSQLDRTPEAEEVRAEMRGWYARFELDADPRKFVSDFGGLLKALDGLAYKAVRGAAVS
ncbi:TOPRIM nucleotidyl transferase/hydrolase domain-containing protein [Gordonia sp. OPL2]|uniref:AAA family ATPase n=1 Tax=Gordonia sp. OPL2 TaxID=2486274 RepID=UPI0016560F77|nr:TOPRIM nucleotidyl transferase/hydrolase domain-containing protein [Gordonia sp. OPL2]RPA10339.1 OLD family endonuclease [Gordonia sp. OPL2]